MPTDVVMPQMGESIAEGTIVRWIKKVGDQVDRDDPLFEISTDKVDAEIPSPAAGVVAEIRAREGETVPVNSVVAVIGEGGGATASQPATAPQPPAPSAPAAKPQAPEAAPPPPKPAPPPASAAQSAPAAPGQAASEAPTERGGDSLEERIRQRSSPLVRKIAKEHNVDI